MEAHGGRIWVENDGFGLGYRCIFTLPVAEETAARRTGPTGIPSAGNGRAARGLGRVLVVEDDPQALWHIRNTLTEAGYTPIATWDPDEVERLIATNAGRTLSRERLMTRVWATREHDDFSMLRGYVRRLRQKLGETADNPRYIFNEPRVGYRLGEAEEQ